MAAAVMARGDAPEIVAPALFADALPSALHWLALMKVRTVDQNQSALAWRRRIVLFERHNL